MRIFFFILIFLVLLACSEEKQTNRIPKLNDTLPEEDYPEQVSWDIKVDFVDSSRKKAVLYAGRARLYPDRKETLLDSNVKVHFYSVKTGKKISTLTSEEAMIEDDTKDMLAKGNVVVVSDSNNTTLETSVLQWDDSERKLYSTEFVRIISPLETLEGHGFESDPNLTNYKIFRVSGIQRNSKLNKK